MSASSRLTAAQTGPGPAAGGVAGDCALELEDVHFRYDVLEAVRGVSLRVACGESVGVVGVNGAGKTTLMSIAAGLLRPSAGRCTAFGEPLDRIGLRARMRRGVMLVPEGRHIIGNLSVQDNIVLGNSCRSVRRPSQEALDFPYEVFPELTEHRDRMAGSLSGGQQQMLAIARALVAKPRLLLLDEPSQGLAPFVQERLVGSLSSLRQAGMTMVVVEQNSSFAYECTDRLYAITQGEVTYSGPWREFLESGGLLRTPDTGTATTAAAPGPSRAT